MLRLIACLVGAAELAGCGVEAATPDPEKDKTAIEAALRQWSTDFNAENVAGVCGLFAEDVVLAYPGGEDRSQVCRSGAGKLRCSGSPDYAPPPGRTMP
jgi:hypothetical protein